MNPNQRYYTASGRFAPGGLIFTLAVAVVGGGLLGALYGALTQVNPLIYLSILGTCGLGAGVGFAVAATARRGHVRSGLITALLGLLGAAVALYANWVAYVNVTLWRADQSLTVFAPDEVWGLMNLMAEIGVWSIKDMTPTGGVLWAIWGLEALLVAGFAVVLSVAHAGEPYCEACGAWAEAEYERIGMGLTADPDGLRSRLEQGDFSALAALGPAEGSPFLGARLRTCPKCRKAGFFDVDEVSISYDDKGNLQEKTHTVVRPLMIDGAALDAARALPQTLHDPADAAE